MALDVPGDGYRRVTEALQREGRTVTHTQVLRLMREESLLCHLKRRYVLTTDSRHGDHAYPHLLAARALGAPDQAGVAAITSMHRPPTCAYLAAILDAGARRCVGWELARCIDTGLTLAALERTLALRQPLPGLSHHADRGVHHADRGVQHARADYVARLARAGVRISLSATGNPYDNATAERFVKTLQREEVYVNEDRTFADAAATIQAFIADVYHTTRLHASLGYLPPVEFEAACASGAMSTPFA